jgi:hypothetical protein
MRWKKTLSLSNHCYLSYIISGGGHVPKYFSEIIIKFMRKPYTSGIGQTMQKKILGWKLF